MRNKITVWLHEFKANFGVDIDVSSVVNQVMSGNAVVILEEECNCKGRVMHNNGGSYHAIDRLIPLVSDGKVVAVVHQETDTREDMPCDRYDYFAVSSEGSKVSLVVIQSLAAHDFECALETLSFDTKNNAAYIRTRRYEGNLIAKSIKGEEFGLERLMRTASRLARGASREQRIAHTEFEELFKLYVASR